MAKKQTYSADYFRKQGSKGGAKSWAKMSKAERTARATKASKAAAVVRSAKKKAKG